MTRRIIRRLWLIPATPLVLVAMALAGAVEGFVEALGEIKREWGMP